MNIGPGLTTVKSESLLKLEIDSVFGIEPVSKKNKKVKSIEEVNICRKCHLGIILYLKKIVIVRIIIAMLNTLEEAEEYGQKKIDGTDALKKTE